MQASSRAAEGCHARPVGAHVDNPKVIAAATEAPGGELVHAIGAHVAEGHGAADARGDWHIASVIAARYFGSDWGTSGRNRDQPLSKYSLEPLRCFVVKVEGASSIAKAIAPVETLYVARHRMHFVSPAVACWRGRAGDACRSARAP